jgi:hypothetical protein
MAKRGIFEAVARLLFVNKLQFRIVSDNACAVRNYNATSKQKYVFSTKEKRSTYIRKLPQRRLIVS